MKFGHIEDGVGVDPTGGRFLTCARKRTRKNTLKNHTNLNLAEMVKNLQFLVLQPFHLFQDPVQDLLYQ